MTATTIARGICAKTGVLLAATFFFGLSVDLASAKEHAARNHAHDRDFYALSNVGEAVDHTSVHHSNCFMTSTAAEAARGIRHWSGSC